MALQMCILLSRDRDSVAVPLGDSFHCRTIPEEFTTSPVEKGCRPYLLSRDQAEHSSTWPIEFRSTFVAVAGT